METKAINEKKELIHRSYVCEVRADEQEEGNIIIGKPIVYDSKTDLYYCYEIIERGALDNTDLTDVRFLVNHDLNKIPLARSRKNNKNSTMQLLVDDSGMTIKVHLDIENNTEARNLYSAIKRGDITGMSFMFSIEAEEWEGLDTEKPTHRIKEISSIVEVSAVTFPAYEDTEIYARDNTDLERLKKTLENVRNKSAKKTVETEQGLDLATRSILKMYN